MRDRTDRDNNITFNTILQYLIHIWMSRGVWNIPRVKSRYIDEIILYKGSVCFTYDDIIGNIVATDWTTASQPGIYNQPHTVIATSKNGKYRKKTHDFVLCYASPNEELIPINVITYYAEKIFRVTRTCDVNAENQLSPKIVMSNSRNKLSMDNIITKLENFVSVIKVKDDFDLKDSVKVLDLTTPYIIDKLMDYDRYLMTRFLTWCGIVNNGIDKAERLTMTESESVLGEVELNRNAVLSETSAACMEVMERWGIEISYRYNTELPIGGNVNGGIHNDATRDNVVNGAGDDDRTEESA